MQQETREHGNTLVGEAEAPPLQPPKNIVTGSFEKMRGKTPQQQGEILRRELKEAGPIVSHYLGGLQRESKLMRKDLDTARAATNAYQQEIEALRRVVDQLQKDAICPYENCNKNLINASGTLTTFVSFTCLPFLFTLIVIRKSWAMPNSIFFMIVCSS